MYIDQLELTNLRTITAAVLDLNHRERPNIALNLPNINLLLGNNGTGKSSVLRALALGILTPVISSSGYVPYSMVRRVGKKFEKKSAISVRLKLHAQDVGRKRDLTGETVRLSNTLIRIGTTEFVKSDSNFDGELWEGMYAEKTPAFLLLAYGATRRVEDSDRFDSGLRKRSRNIRYQRVASLFEDHVSLIPLASWLPQLAKTNRGRFTQVRNLIDQLLPAPFGFDGKQENGEYVFKHGDQSVPFPALSDGYKAYLGWITDMLYHICMGCPPGKKLVDNFGIVLIDEIDLHLHPAWQRVVVPMIAAALPNIQFILTTHSPIVTGTMQSANIFVVAEGQSGESTVEQFKEKVHGLTSEQVLLSSYFDLSSTRAPAVTGKIETLVAAPDQNPTQRALKALSILTPEKTENPETGASGSRLKRIYITSVGKEQVAPLEKRKAAASIKRAKKSVPAKKQEPVVTVKSKAADISKNTKRTAAAPRRK
jgi:predicted ATPase